MPQRKAIEICRPGTFKATNGIEITFTAAKLARVAEIYDPQLKQAPITTSHKAKAGEEAQGWIGALEFSADRLRATPEQVPAAFAEKVSSGAFKYVSPAFYLPDQPNNPKPGEFYLHHVAVLGAEAPAIPGLAPVTFSDGEAGIAFTSEIPSGPWTDMTLIRLLRGIKNWIIEQAGAEKAEQIIPEGDLSWAQADAVREQERVLDRAASALATYAEPNQETETMDPKAHEAAIAAKDEEIKRRDAQLTALRKQQQTATFAANETFVAGLVEEGKLPSGNKAATVALLNALAAPGGVAFSESGEAAPITFSEPAAEGQQPAEVKVAPLELAKKILGAFPKMVTTDEVAGADRTAAAFAASTDPVAIAGQITAKQAEAAKSGVQLSASQALELLQKGK